MSLDEQFNAAKEKISATSQGPQEQLKLYGLYKQAVLGDNTGERPGIPKIREFNRGDNFGSAGRQFGRDGVSRARRDALDQRLDDGEERQKACSAASNGQKAEHELDRLVVLLVVGARQKHEHDRQNVRDRQNQPVKLS